MIATNCDNQGEADRCYGDGVTICKEIDEAIKLEEVDKKYADVSIGSYPHFNTSGGGFKNQIVLRSKNSHSLKLAAADVEAMLVALKEKLGVA